MTPELKYLTHYAEPLQQSIIKLIKEDRLQEYLLNKYPDPHSINNDKALRDFVMQYKSRFLKKSDPVNKVIYDPKIHIVKNALGTHTQVSRVQGSKLKSKKEIRISSLFKNASEDFLSMIVVHELAHVKEQQHNKAFYQLCCHMLPEYHQLEFDVRVYLTCVENVGEIY